MQQKSGFLLFLLITNLFVTFGQTQKATVTISGKELPYAGYTIEIQKIKNPISNELTDLAVINVDSTGRFALNLALEEITYCFLNLGKYRGTIYLEPGRHYEIALPQLNPKSEADLFNPYFIPEDISIGITNLESQDLNKQITSFVADFNARYNKSARTIFQRNDNKLAEQIKTELDSLYPTATNSYFARFKHYTYGKLDFISNKRQLRRVITKVYKSDNIATHIPPYNETFNLLFQNFFGYYFTSKNGTELRDAYKKGVSFDTLSTVFAKDTLFADPSFRELVLLKSLYDAFYTKQYDEIQIINLLKNAASTGSTDYIRTLAQQLYIKTNSLRVGTPAPDFTLYRLDGKEISLDKYKGKFIYLNFIHSENHACKQDLQRLNVMHQKMKRDLVILTIVMDKDPSLMKSIIDENKFKWDFLHYANQPNIYFNYNLKALPTYYLIDPNGNLKLSPSPGPSENFTDVFEEAVRSYNYDQLRKNKPRTKNIYDF